MDGFGNHFIWFVRLWLWSKNKNHTPTPHPDTPHRCPVPFLRACLVQLRLMAVGCNWSLDGTEVTLKLQTSPTVKVLSHYSAQTAGDVLSYKRRSSTLCDLPRSLLTVPCSPPPLSKSLPVNTEPRELQVHSCHFQLDAGSPSEELR